MTGRRAFLLFAAAYLASLAALAAAGRPLAEPLFLLAVLGVALPGLAWLVCRGLPAREAERPVAGEGALLAALVLFVTLFLAVKGPLLELLAPEAGDARLREAVNALLKLAAFVAVPLLAYRLRCGLSPRALGLAWPPPGPRGRMLLAFAVVGAALAAVQLVFGSGARPLLDGSLAGRPWVLGLVLAWLWMSLEAGLVEEVFFRVILQSRLAARTGSPVAGLFLAALVFGLAHAPGLWLRGAGVVEGLGESPSLLLSIAYSVTTMGVAGLAFGVLWLRTRNWLLVVALHGLTDALANTVRFMDTWGL